MKPVKLTLKGINSFEKLQVIDFEALTRQGVFGIFGPTGSGKSSILDGITLALYGEVARESRNFINVNMEQASVEFTFLIREGGVKRYQVSRSFRRDKKNGNVRTSSAKLIFFKDGEEEVLAERAKEVNQLCYEIIGLSREDFFRTVILPQGRFFDFLKLEGVARSRMLERLFHLEKYGDELSAKVNARWLCLKDEYQTLAGYMDAQGDVSKEAIETLKKEEECLQKDLESEKGTAKGEERKIRRLEKLLEVQDALQMAKEKVDQLARKREEMEAAAKKAEYAKKAALLLELEAERNERKKKEQTCLKEWEETEKNYRTAEKKSESLRQQWEIFSGIYKEKMPKLAVWIERLENAVNEWKQYETSCARMEILKQEKADIGKKLSEKKSAQEEKQKELETLKIERRKEEQKERQYQEKQVQRNFLEEGYFCQKDCKRIESEIKRLKKENEILLLEDWEEKKRECESSLEKIKITMVWMDIQKERTDYEQLKAEYEMSMRDFQEKEKVMEETKEKKEHAQKVYEEKYREGLAAILAGELKEGMPCPVCGSVHHPGKLKKTVEQIHLSGFRREKTRLEEEERRLAGELLVCKSVCVQKEEKMVSSQNLLREKEQKYLEQTERMTKKPWEEETWTKDKEKEMQEKADSFAMLQQETDRELGRWMIKMETCQKSMHTLSQQLDRQKEKLEGWKRKTGILDFEQAWEDEKEREKRIETIRGCIHALREKEELLERECQEFSQSRQKFLLLLARLEEEGRILKADIQRKEEKGVENPKEELEQAGQQKKQMEDTYQSLCGNLKNAQEEKEEWEQKRKNEQRRAQDAKLLLNEAEERLLAKMEESPFSDIEDVRVWELEEELILSLEKTVQEYTDSWTRENAKVLECRTQLNGETVEKEQILQLAESAKKRAESIEIMQRELGKMRAEKERMCSQYERYKELLNKKKELEHKVALVNELYQILKGKQFVNYAAKYHLDYIAMDADERLKEMSNGAYGMETDEEGIFLIRDYKNGGILRSAQTLSGGETFMASLALALSLSARIQMKGKAPLELFFLDEGFGTLDKESLDVVMQSLEHIHGERMAVGLITHVEEIKERVDSRLILSPARAGEGGSKIKMEIL